ncbi:hypothetical protein WN944_028694 [Citrus x changshan-huyou]|uniref:Uncharacterized protein n=1 Tax=Citrus x changshan-huyou TaxID=2935761 RepID=A0AAP0Q9N4_9ROSI
MGHLLNYVALGHCPHFIRSELQLLPQPDKRVNQVGHAASPTDGSNPHPQFLYSSDLLLKC